MPFAKFRVEMAVQGASGAVLRERLAFDELALLTENLAYVQRCVRALCALGLCAVCVQVCAFDACLLLLWNNGSKPFLHLPPCRCRCCRALQLPEARVHAVTYEAAMALAQEAPLIAAAAPGSPGAVFAFAA